MPNDKRNFTFYKTKKTPTRKRVALSDKQMREAFWQCRTHRWESFPLFVCQNNMVDYGVTFIRSNYRHKHAKKMFYFDFNRYLFIASIRCFGIEQ